MECSVLPERQDPSFAGNIRLLVRYECLLNELINEFDLLLFSFWGRGRGLGRAWRKRLGVMTIFAFNAKSRRC